MDFKNGYPVIGNDDKPRVVYDALIYGNHLAREGTLTESSDAVLDPIIRSTRKLGAGFLLHLGEYAPFGRHVQLDVTTEQLDDVLTNYALMRDTVRDDKTVVHIEGLLNQISQAETD